jgi:chemotaxis-related protein WspB
MLFLLFQIGNDRYALEASRVVEVVPLLTIKQWPQAPPGLAGIFNYHGQPVPAIDLSQLTLGNPATERLSTRIIIVNHTDGRGRNQLLGLVAEHATEVVRKDPKEFVDSGIRIGGAPYLGPVLMDAQGPIQWVHEQRLLSEPVRELLFSEPEPLSGLLGQHALPSVGRPSLSS